MLTTHLPIGPFNFSISTNVNAVYHDVKKLYADFPALNNNAFIDFPITIKTPSGPRRYIHPQVDFYFDEFKPFKPLPKNQAYPMLEWGLNWCVANHAHQFLVLHAAAVESNDKVILMPAEQGSGKSTLSSALMHLGWRLFSDELGLISLNNSLVYPCTRPINLKNNSIGIINKTFSNSIFSNITHDTHKGTVALLKPSNSSVRLMHKPAQLSSFVFPRYKQGVPAKLTEISPLTAFEKLINNSFNYHVLGEAAFHLLSTLLQDIPCYDFEYSNFDEANKLLSQITNS